MIIYKNAPLDVGRGETYLSVAKRVQPEYDAPIILAKLGQKIVEYRTSRSLRASVCRTRN